MIPITLAFDLKKSRLPNRAFTHHCPFQRELRKHSVTHGNHYKERALLNAPFEFNAYPKYESTFTLAC